MPEHTNAMTMTFPGYWARSRTLMRMLFPSLAVLVLAGFSGCDSVKPLTPEEQSFVSAWGVRENLQKAFKAESVDQVLATLSPDLADSPKTRKDLSDMFETFRTLDFQLVMDSGTIDETARTIHFRAHWTMTGVPKSKTARHYFQTGECRVDISLRKSPAPSRIQRILGDTFLALPGKPSPSP